jgi:L-fucose mutarotase/ribose pyranase (RbsD/FucU family)
MNRENLNDKIGKIVDNMTALSGITCDDITDISVSDFFYDGKWIYRIVTTTQHGSYIDSANRTTLEIL